ncbi:helix-turn-helix domain-containing protein [Pseudonocardia hispaniensis]|uniref:Helix-turn-helix domain-containing protein n=1 Tax=Pseudonocardia hispaniensis TaxID=904933 RepID=A0ABW1IWR3_9PSEU
MSAPSLPEELASAVADAEPVVYAVKIDADTLATMLTVRQLSELLNMGYQTALRLVRSGRIRSRKIGTHYLVPVSAYVEYQAGADDPSPDDDE